MPLSDEQRSRFLRAARGGRLIQSVRALILATVFIVLQILAIGLIDEYSWLAIEWPQRRRLLPGLLWLAIVIAGLVLPALVTVLLGRESKAALLGLLLDERTTCPECRYDLSGLGVPDNETLTCPECGLVHPPRS